MKRRKEARFNRWLEDIRQRIIGAGAPGDVRLTDRGGWRGWHSKGYAPEEVFNMTSWAKNMSEDSDREPRDETP